MIPEEVIVNKIFLVRGYKVMLDNDIANLYGVETKRLNEQVKRNGERFPGNFMFQLTREEFGRLKSQNATSSWGGRRKLPYAFTEHGILMLANVLKSERAIIVSIRIIEVFVKIREMLVNQKDIIERLDKIEGSVSEHEGTIIEVLNYIQRLEEEKMIETEQKRRKRIGFRINRDNTK